MHRVIWSEPALEDLRRINRWLTREYEPERALKTLVTVRNRADWLIYFPHGGRPHKGGERILRMYGTPYLILYALRGERLDVLRVHHERENWFVEP